MLGTINTRTPIEMATFEFNWNSPSKVCRKSKIQIKPKPRVNNVVDTSSDAATNGTSANRPNVVKVLDDYIQTHGVPRNNSLDQARCLIANKVEKFCKQDNMNIITATSQSDWISGAFNTNN